LGSASLASQGWIGYKLVITKRSTPVAKLEFPKRMIHLDFHTGPDVPDVGKDFDADVFARSFKDAHVDSVTVFAMGHHGHLYYDTKHPARHPSLPADLNLLGSQIDALRSAGIRAPIYITVQVNEYAANQHLDWVAIDPEGRQVKRGGPLSAGWYVLDMSSPYQEYLTEVIQEVLDIFAPTDGLFLDMCWDQPSVSKWAIKGMLKQNLDPRIEDHRDLYARRTAHGYMKRYRDMVEAAHKKSKPAGVWFNSRPKTNIYEEKKFLRHVEVEALPTGGWGYAYFPYVARLVRPLKLPTLSHTGRFFKSWGDNASLKPKAALKYECCQILSQGMTSGIGDLLHPRGVPQKAVYDLIGEVYEHIEKCEPFVDGGRVVSQIALIVDPDLGDNPGPSGIGAVRALQQLRQQFDIVPRAASLDAYELAIVPESTMLDEKAVGILSAYLKDGGSLILCGPAALNADGGPVLKEMNVTVDGQSPFSHTFLRAKKSVNANLAEYDYVMYEPGFRMKPGKGAESLVRIVEPYFEREYHRFSGHSYTPPAKLSPYSAAVRNGQVITFSVPILEAYGKHASPNYRDLVGNCIDLLLPEPFIRDNGPTKLETTVIQKGKTTIVHLISFYPERRADDLDIVEDVLPLVDTRISVKLPKAPKRATLQPHGVELTCEYADGYAEVSVTLLDGHGMLVFE
jgi:hypothetical protein